MDKKLPKVGVVGIGFVGGAVVRGFNLFAEIRTYDKDPKRCMNTLEEVLESDFVFVCLPTPMSSAEGGDCDLSIIDSFFADAAGYIALKKDNSIYHRNPIFIIKSTVPIGTTHLLCEKYWNLSIVHSPEFLTARSANLDFITPARNIIGGDTEWAEQVAVLYKERFPGTPIYIMNSDESEMVKYAANCFFATKVIFFNEMYMLADRMGLDWNNILEGLLSDGRIAKSHYQVPGHDGSLGYGGTCFPKDVNAMIHTMEKFKIDSKLLKAGWEQNKAIRKNWDWADNPSAVRKTNDS